MKKRVRLKKIHTKKKYRFVIYNYGVLKTSLRFDFSIMLDNHEIPQISITEEDFFLIETVFSKSIDGYLNYGHWGRHIITNNKKNEIINQINVYVDLLEKWKEDIYLEKINVNKLKDIRRNRKGVIKLANSLKKWLEESDKNDIVLNGI